MQIKSSGAVLRIVSENKSIDDISDSLNTRPTRCFIKGQLFSKRNPNSKKRENNIWLLESGLKESESLELHIQQLISFIKEKQGAFKKLKLDCEIEIMCSFSSGNGQGGFTLNHELLQELTESGIDLVVNLYPPERR